MSVNGNQASDRFLRLKEVQTLLGISRTTLWRWANERGLKVVRVGDVARIRESDLQAFLSRHETSAARAEPQSDNGGVQSPQPLE